MARRGRTLAFVEVKWRKSADKLPTAIDEYRLRRVATAARILASRHAKAGDDIRIATWLLPAERKLEARRRFQVRRAADGDTLARAEVQYVCIELSTGRPTRWPAEFRARYVALPAVIECCTALAPV